MKSTYFKTFFKNKFDFNCFKNINKFAYFFKIKPPKSKYNFKNQFFNFAKQNIPILSSLGFISFFSLNNVALCYHISDKEIDKLRLSVENQIKNLEFKYQGKLRHQNIK